MSEYSYNPLKKPIAIILLIWVGFTMLCIMGLKYSAPLMPSLVPHGMIFGILSLVMLAAYCIAFKIKKSIGWIIAVWILFTPVYFFGFGLLHPSSLKGAARIILGNSDFSLIMVSVMVLRDKW